MDNIVSGYLEYPVEVWGEMILINLEDGEHILNAFRAFAIRIRRHRRSQWFFDHVFPYIFPRLKREDIFFFRLVCKRWRRGVDDFLENHPSRRAYDHERRITSQAWPLEASPANYNFNQTLVLTTSLKHTNDLESRIQNLDAQIVARNPFVGGECDISDWSSRESATDIQEFWMNVLVYLLNVGHHIWFLNIECRGKRENVPPTFYPKVILAILRTVPNLKSLNLAVGMGSDRQGSAENTESWLEVDKFLEENKELFPLLPNLETLVMDSDDTGSLLMFLLNRYSARIRKLVTRMHYCNEIPHPHFPNLTELSIHDFYPSNQRTIEFLQSLNSPHLHYLYITLSLAYKRQSAEVQNTLLSCVRPFPRLQNMRLHFRSRNGLIHDARADSMPPIQIFLPLRSISFSNHTDITMENLRFLECFPSLEYIQTDSMCLLFRVEDDVKGSRLWEKLPNLKGIVEVTPNYKKVLHRRG